MRIVWQRDLSCVIGKEDWCKVLSHSNKYIREARGKFTQYKLIHRWYFTPSKLHRMGIMPNNICWKCSSVPGTFLHAIWECGTVYPFWQRVLDSIARWIGLTIPMSPRLCLLGDQSVLPGVLKYDFVVIKVGVITAA